MFKSHPKLKIFLPALFVLALSLFIAKGLLDRQAKISRPVLPLLKAAPPAGARMAIILDDWGKNFRLTRQAVEIDRPLTLAILPHLRYSRKIAEEAHRANLGVMLHMPMEPKKASKHMEPRTILTTSTDAEVVRYLDEALESIPYAEGLNNHMGSKATSDTRIMRLVLERLRDRDLFFVDSFVTKETVSPGVARRLGLPFARRSVFIDNVPKKEAIKEELIRAAAIALKKGQVVVIGHDKKTTLAAIKEALPDLEKAGVRLVFVRDLVSRQNS